MKRNYQVIAVFCALIMAGCLYVPTGGSGTADPHNLSNCTPNQNYDVTLQARNQFHWPFGDSCGNDDFANWFRTQHKNKWLGRKIFFDGLDNKALSQVHLEHETLTVEALVFDRDGDDFKQADISLNGFHGASLNQNAITFNVLHDIKFEKPVKFWDDEAIEKDDTGEPIEKHSHLNKDHPDYFSWHRNYDWDSFESLIKTDYDNRHPSSLVSDINSLVALVDDIEHDGLDRDDADEFRDDLQKTFDDLHDDFNIRRDSDGKFRHHRIHIVRARIVQISFHLEDYAFGINHTASDLIRASAASNGSVEFKLRKLHGRILRYYRASNGTLELQGQYPGLCPTPTPKPSASPSPTPKSSPTPKPSATPKPTPTPVPSPTPLPVVTITATSVGTLTNNNAITVAFISNVSATFTCSLDSAPYSACTSPFTQSALKDGAHYFAVEAIAANGTVSTPAQYDWTVDTTPPTVTFGTVTPSGNEIKQNQITINFSASESSTFQCSVDSATATPCSSPVSLSNLTDGPHTLGVLATDLAGNVSSMATYSWTVKTIPPTVTLTQIIPSTSPSSSTTRTFYFTGSTDATTFSCALDAATAASCTSPFTLTGLTDGAHQFSVTADDVVGNASTPAVSQFTIDTTPPEVVITSTVPPQSPTNNSNMQISFSANESSTFECSIDSATLTPCTSPMNYSNLTQGNHEFQVMAVDTAGNVSTSAATYEWTVDQTPPVITLVSANPTGSVTNQTQITLTFSVNKSATVACALDSNPSTDCSSDSVTYSGLADGAHTITATATDAAGNVGKPLSYTFTVDTNKPAVQITSVDPSTSVIAVTTITFSFSATDIEPLKYNCQLDGASAKACTSPITYSNLKQGSHVFNVTATDTAGNSSVSPATYNFTVDLNPPVTSISSETPSVSPTTSTTISFTFTADKPSTFVCALDDGGSQACTSPMTYNGLADGNHTFVVIATDVVGTVDPLGAAYSWSVSTTPLMISNFRVGNVTANSATLYWDTNLPSDSQVFYALYPSTTYTSTTEDPSQTVSHQVTLTGLQTSGYYSVYGTSNGGVTTTTSPVINFSTLR